MKTAVINLIHNADQKGEEIDVNSLAACFQSTVGQILTDKFIAAAQEFGYKKIALAGGVAANSGLRETLDRRGKERNDAVCAAALTVRRQRGYDRLSGVL